MNYILFINLLLFIISSVGYLILFRFLDYNYQLNNFWFNNALTCILSPIYMLKIIINSKNRLNFKNTFKNGSFKYIFIAGSLYSLESILVYYCMISLSLFDYIIFRSSFIVWNIPLFKYFLNKKISSIYLSAVFFLIISQLILITLNSQNIPIYIILFSSCLISSIYNCLMEYTLKTYEVDIYVYHTIFQLVYFISSIGESIYFSDIPMFSVELIFIYIFISIFTQYYCYSRLIILKIENTILPTNVLLAGLEFLRRIIIITFSCIFFKESYNIYSGILFCLSSFMLFYDYYKSLTHNKQNIHIELEDIV
jgi:hypothetical protein